MDEAGGTPRPEIPEYKSENAFVLFAAAIMLLSADLALRTGTTFCRAKRSSSVAPCDGRLTVVCVLLELELDFACDGGGRSGVTISKPGSLGRPPASGDERASMVLPSVTGLRRERLREWRGCGETTLKELDVDKLALTPDRPSDTLSDIAPASLVVANSLANARVNN
jgi:hypothetical protein